MKSNLLMVAVCVLFGIVLIFEVIGIVFLIKSYFFSGSTPHSNLHMLWLLIGLSILTGGLGIVLTLFYRHFRQPELESKVRSIQEDYLGLDSILQESPDIILALHKDGNIYYWNKKAEKTFQKKASDMIGRNLFEKAEFFRKYRSHCDFARAHNEEIWMLDEKMSILGFEKIWSMVIYPAGNEDLVIQMTDITDSMQIMRRESNYGKMEIMEGMMNGFQHRFNNYLSGILGYTDLLRDDSPGPDVLAHKENIRRIVSEFKDNVGLLRTFSTVKIDAEIGIVDIVETVNASLKNLADFVPENLSIAEDVQTHNTKVLGSAYMLEKVFTGLLRYILNNVAQHDGQRELKIEFKTMLTSSSLRCKGNTAPDNDGRRKEEYLRVDIRKLTQTEESKLVHDIFSPFDRIGSDLSLFELTVAYHIIKNHKGDIYADGDALVVLIPRMRDVKEIRMVEKEDHSDMSRPMGKKSILIVEDDSEMRTILNKFLEPLDYDVTLAKSSAECMRLLGERAFNLVILDLVLPDARGDTCLETIKKRDPNTAVILSTGYPNKDALNDLKGKYPGLLFLSKPYALNDLVVMIEKVLKTVETKVT